MVLQQMKHVDIALAHHEATMCMNLEEYQTAKAASEIGTALAIRSI